jgi:hypothetical protein
MALSRQHVAAAQDVAELFPHVQFYYPESKKEFGDHFPENKERLIELFTEVASWIAAQLEIHNSVSVLGL